MNKRYLTCYSIRYTLLICGKLKDWTDSFKGAIQRLKLDGSKSPRSSVGKKKKIAKSTVVFGRPLQDVMLTQREYEPTLATLTVPRFIDSALKFLNKPGEFR